MPITYTNPFNGLSSKTCSISTVMHSKVPGSTEAQWEKQQHLGTWGVVKGKIQAGNMPEGFFAEVEGPLVHYKYGMTHGNLVKFDMDAKHLVGTDLEGLDSIVNEVTDLYGVDWKWVGNFTPKEGAVKLGSKSVGAMSDEDVASLFVSVKDDIATLKGVNLKGANPLLDQEVYAKIGVKTGYTSVEVKAKVDAYKATGKKLSSLKKKLKKGKPKTIDVPKVKVPELNLDDLGGEWIEPPTAVVPTEAATATVKEAVDELASELPKYLDEEVAKAYIKAKDELAASTDNPWTLYTQHNKDFEDAISHLMSKNYDISLYNYQIRQQISRYLSGGNKLSVLKKKMMKQGEYHPIAPTLKKSKNALMGDNTSVASKTAAKKQIDEMAGFYNPEGFKPYDWHGEGYDAAHQLVFVDLKNDLYASMSDENVYLRLKKYHDELTGPGGMFGTASVKPSILDVVRAYDIQKAKQLGIENTFFYEKKVTQFASSPIGKTKILEAKNAKEAEALMPGLPADSAGFTTISTDTAREMQAALKAWEQAESSAIRNYTASGYIPMNGALRGGQTISNSIKALQAGMRPMERDFLVHRGCSFTQFGLDSYEHAITMVGKKVEEKGFMSTSVGGQAAMSGNVMIECEIPQGTYGAYVKSISSHSSENEFIVAAGTRYTVLSVKKEGYRVVVRVRAIPGTQKKMGAARKAAAKKTTSPYYGYN